MMYCAVKIKTPLDSIPQADLNFPVKSEITVPPTKRIISIDTNPPEEHKTVSSNQIMKKKGYNPDTPSFALIDRYPKDIWHVLHQEKKDFPLPACPNKPIFIHDSIAIADSSSFSYSKYMVSLNSNSLDLLRDQQQSLKSDWVLGIIIISLLLLTWVKIFFNKYLTQIINSLVNYQLSFKLFRDRNVLFVRISGLLNTIFVLNIGLFLYFTLDHYNLHLFPYSGFVNFLLYCLLITGFSFLQVIILKVLGVVFLRSKEYVEYIHNIFLSNKGIGLFLLPVIIGLPYISDILIKPLIYTGLTIIILLYLWRFFRGFKIIVNKDILKFYLILYFCTLEILPVLLLYKYLHSTVYTGGL